MDKLKRNFKALIVALLLPTFSFACSCVNGVFDDPEKVVYFEVIDIDSDGFYYNATVLVYRTKTREWDYPSSHYITQVSGTTMGTACGYKLEVGNSYMTVVNKQLSGVNICNTRGLGKEKTRVLSKNFRP